MKGSAKRRVETVVERLGNKLKSDEVMKLVPPMTFDCPTSWGGKRQITLLTQEEIVLCAEMIRAKKESVANGIY